MLDYYHGIGLLLLCTVAKYNARDGENGCMQAYNAVIPR